VSTGSKENAVHAYFARRVNIVNVAKKKAINKLNLCCAIVVGSLAIQAQAQVETSSAILGVSGTSEPAMVIACTDVNFGVWRVPLGRRSGGATVISLDTDGNTRIDSGSTANIALAGGRSAPAYSLCTVSGSNAASGSQGEASLIGASGAFAGNISGTSGFESELTAAPVGALTSMTYSMALSNTVPSIQNGAASFKIHGTITIPDGLALDSYGDYKSPTVEISFDDKAASE
jgi:hypothetical protein